MMTEHWLSIAAGVFLVGMMLYGHYRGLLRQCVSLGVLVLTIITVKVATPYVTDFVKANPVIRENAAHFIMEVSGWQPPEGKHSSGGPAYGDRRTETPTIGKRCSFGK